MCGLNDSTDAGELKTQAVLYPSQTALLVKEAKVNFARHRTKDWDGSIYFHRMICNKYMITYLVEFKIVRIS